LVYQFVGKTSGYYLRATSWAKLKGQEKQEFALRVGVNFINKIYLPLKKKETKKVIRDHIAVKTGSELKHLKLSSDSV